MLIKIILVTMIVLLSWNSFKQSETTDLLRHQLKELVTVNKKISKQVTDNKNLFNDLNKTIGKNTRQIKASASKQVKSFNENKKALAQIKKSTSEIAANAKNQSGIPKELTASFKKQTDALLKDNKGIKYLVNKHKSTLDENKKDIALIKKDMKLIASDVKKQLRLLTANANKSQYGKVAENQSGNKAMSQKVRLDPEKERRLKEEANKNNHEYHKEKFEKAVIQLAQLKSEQWKYRAKEEKTRQATLLALSLIDKAENNHQQNGNSKAELTKKYKKEYVPIKGAVDDIDSLIEKQSKILGKVTMPVPKNKLIVTLNKAKVFHKKVKINEAITELAELKDEVWKCRETNIDSKELILSTLSSIDITEQKWRAKDFDYDLGFVDKKVNLLVDQTGLCK